MLHLGMWFPLNAENTGYWKTSNEYIIAITTKREVYEYKQWIRNYNTFFIPIIFNLSSSPIAITESTTIWAKNSFSPPMSLEESVVAAHFANKLFFSSRLFPSMLTASSLVFSIAYKSNEILHTINKPKT